MSRTAKFIFQKDVQEIFNYFTRFLGIRIVFFSYDGQELTAGDDRLKCKYCRLLREKLGFENICIRLDREKQILAKKKRALITYKCHGGMIEAGQSCGLRDIRLFMSTVSRECRIYKYDYVMIPIVLEAGDNYFLFRCSRFGMVKAAACDGMVTMLNQ